MAWWRQWGILVATASGVVVKSDGLDSTGYVASMLSWFLRITRSTDLEISRKYVDSYYLYMITFVRRSIGLSNTTWGIRHAFTCFTSPEARKYGGTLSVFTRVLPGFFLVPDSSLISVGTSYRYHGVCL